MCFWLCSSGQYHDVINIVTFRLHCHIVLPVHWRRNFVIGRVCMSFMPFRWRYRSIRFYQCSDDIKWIWFIICKTEKSTSICDELLHILVGINNKHCYLCCIALVCRQVEFIDRGDDSRIVSCWYYHRCCFGTSDNRDQTTTRCQTFVSLSCLLVEFFWCSLNVYPIKAKFHYASWFGAGSEHVRS